MASFAAWQDVRLLPDLGLHTILLLYGVLPNAIRTPSLPFRPGRVPAGAPLLRLQPADRLRLRLRRERRPGGDGTLRRRHHLEGPSAGDRSLGGCSE